jgi:hypothetical protein
MTVIGSGLEGGTDAVAATGRGDFMDTSMGTCTARTELRVGTRVDVHTRFEVGRWAPGFTIAEVRPDGYRIRRASDGVVLNEIIHADELRVVRPLPSRPLDAEFAEGTLIGDSRLSTSIPGIGLNQ